jgi:hypothetical protein
MPYRHNYESLNLVESGIACVKRDAYVLEQKVQLAAKQVWEIQRSWGNDHAFMHGTVYGALTLITYLISRDAVLVASTLALTNGYDLFLQLLKRREANRTRQFADNYLAALLHKYVELEKVRVHDLQTFSSIPPRD